MVANRAQGKHAQANPSTAAFKLQIPGLSLKPEINKASSKRGTKSSAKPLMAKVQPTAKMAGSLATRGSAPTIDAARSQFSQQLQSLTEGIQKDFKQIDCLLTTMVHKVVVGIARRKPWHLHIVAFAITEFADLYSSLCMCSKLAIACRNAAVCGVNMT